MDNVVTRKGKPEDAEDFSQLALFTAPTFLPYLFGSDVRNSMKKLFQCKRNYFSFEHSYFIELNGKIAGMALLYSYEEKKREYSRTFLLGLKYLKWHFFAQLSPFLKSERIMAQITEGDCYLAFIAVYPEFRGRGLGTKLLGVIEEEAKRIGSRRVALDVEISDEGAIKLYKRLGYDIERKAPIFKIKDKNFELFNMSKNI